jgi:hypothetical protein
MIDKKDEDEDRGLVFVNSYKVVQIFTDILRVL